MYCNEESTSGLLTPTITSTRAAGGMGTVQVDIEPAPRITDDDKSGNVK
jgi:hypothetical protein